jgi:GAF domain-containing protein/HAMP domain-containing protein
MNITNLFNRQRPALAGFLSNTPIGWKMGSMVLVLFAGMLAITFSAYLGMQSLRYQLSNIYEFMLVPIVAINQADAALSNAQYHITQSHNQSLSIEERKNYASQILSDTKISQEIIVRYDIEWVTTTSAEFTQALREAGKLDLQEKELSALENIHTTFETYETLLTQYLATVEAGTPDINLAEKTSLQLQEVSENLQILIVINNEFAEFSNEIAQNSFRQSIINGGFALVVALTIGLAISYLITISITNRLNILVKSAENLQQGDFTQNIIALGRDEVGFLGIAFNDMSQQLNEMVTTLEQRVVERTKALANVAEIGTATSAIRDLEKMLMQFVYLTQRRFGLYHAHIFLYEEETDLLRIIACGWKEGDEHEGTHGTTTIPLTQEQSLVARAARSRQPVIVNDVRSDPGWLPNPLLPDTASELAVPLFFGDKLIGVLDVQSEQLDAFTEADADVQLTLSAQVAVAIENIRQFENTQKIASDLGVVAQVGIATATITDIEKLLQEVVDLSKESFNLYHAHIYMMNEAGNALELAAGAGEVGRQMVAEKRSIPMNAEQSLVVRAAVSQQGVIANDVAADPNFLPNPLLPETRAEMAVPMIVSNKVIGVLDVQSETIGRFTEVDVNIKTTLASQIAVAVQNARNLDQSRRQAERETAVNLIAQKIQSATNVEAALQVAARELGHALGMKQTLVLLGDGAPDNKTQADAS